MKLSTVIRRAIAYRNKYPPEGNTLSCGVCTEMNRREGPLCCVFCPVGSRMGVVKDILDAPVSISCQTLAMGVYKGDKDAVRAAEEIALACEMQDD